MGSAGRDGVWSKGGNRQQQGKGRYPIEVERALEGVQFIADHLRDDDKEVQVYWTDKTVRVAFSTLMGKHLCQIGPINFVKNFIKRLILQFP